MSYVMITAENDSAVLKITLNRPDRLNACPPAMADEIFDALADTGNARAVLFTGAGRAFCSGADLAAGKSASSNRGEGSYASLQKHYNPMIQRLCTLPLPVVSAVQGPAAGIGCSIALAADFVVASKSGFFLQAFANIGLVPDGGASWMLPRLVGLARATRMMMLGERIYGEEAEAIGLIYKCVEDDALQNEASELVQRLANGPTVALSQMKQTIRTGLQSDLNSVLQMEAIGQRIAGNSDDAKEGASAFIEKRKAEFTGS